MLSKLLPIIFLTVGLGAGVGAGLATAPQEPGQTDEHGTSVEQADEAEEETSEYVKLNNQFVVPVVHKDRVASLVVLSLSLETKIGYTEQVYAIEPKLRDAFLRVLFDHSNMGGFQGSFTRSDRMELLRTALREVAHKQMGDSIVDVLITDISRQDT